MTNARDEIVTDARGATTGDGAQHFAAPTTLTESVVASEVRPVGLRRVVNERGAHVRWGAVCTGATVAVATYMLLDLLLVAVEALDVGNGGGDGLPDGMWWSLIAGAVAFLIGGLVAGASNPSRRSGDGVLHGLGAWGLGIVILVLFAIAITGFVFGGLGEAIARLDQQQGATSGANAADDLKEAAGMAALTIAATAVAAAIGGLIGTKLRSSGDQDDALRLHGLGDGRRDGT